MVDANSLNTEQPVEAGARAKAAAAGRTVASNRLRVDFSREIGTVRPLHGINFGPLSLSGILDFSREYRKLGIPITRLHDCPYAIPGTVDIHNLFPLFHADHNDSANFVFPITDDYIQSIVDVGSEIVFRLGETIEHHKRGKYFIHPPADFHKWAEICLQVIRHYNEGWANGFRHGITYWEIWNEPWALCWTGTAEEFYRLYEITAKRIKSHAPDLKVGSGGSGSWDEFLDGLVRHCRKSGTPLDFLVWHSYQHHPKENARLARCMRKRLDEAGFPEAEIHLNEWAHLPDNNWSFVGHRDEEQAAGARELIARIQGAPGAAFTATMFAWMQDLPVDVSNYYWGREGIWGLFDWYGGQTRLYQAFKAFNTLREIGVRVHAEGNDEEAGFAVLAAVDNERRKAAILLSHFESDTRDFSIAIEGIPWDGPTRLRVLAIDERHMFDEVEQRMICHSGEVVPLEMSAPSVRLLILERDD